MRLPEQNPVLPQVETASVAHSLSGSWPAGIAVHVPTVPPRLHFSQTPPHRVSQQTPSVQKPWAHSASVLHD